MASDGLTPKHLDVLLTVSSLNSRVVQEVGKSGELRAVGDATELGLYKFAVFDFKFHIFSLN